MKALQEPNLSIDTTSPQTLINQAREHPNIYCNYSKMLALAKDNVASQKLNMDIVKSQAGKRIRETEGTISETKLDKLLFDDAEYIAAVKLYNNAKLQEAVVASYVSSLEDRIKIILTACALMKEELKQLGVSEHI